MDESKKSVPIASLKKMFGFGKSKPSSEQQDAIAVAESDKLAAESNTFLQQIEQVSAASDSGKNKT